MFQLRQRKSACRPPNGPQNNIRQKGPNYDRTTIPQQQKRRDEVAQDKGKKERNKEQKNERLKETKKEMLLLFLFYVKL